MKSFSCNSGWLRQEWLFLFWGITKCKGNMAIFKSEKGFTLIEIIAVLIIVGTLSAVAVPKYLDLQDKVRMKAAQGAITEIKARCSLQWAKLIMANNGDISQATATAVLSNIDANLGPDFLVNMTAPGFWPVGSHGQIVITVSQVQGVSLSTNLVSTWVAP